MERNSTPKLDAVTSPRYDIITPVLLHGDSLLLGLGFAPWFESDFYHRVLPPNQSIQHDVAGMKSSLLGDVITLHIHHTTHSQSRKVPPLLAQDKDLRSLGGSKMGHKPKTYHEESKVSIKI